MSSVTFNFHDSVVLITGGSSGIGRAIAEAYGRAGAVVVIASDGWERGGPELLGQQVARLSRLAHAVIWANPHRGKPGYAPVQGGIRAALPVLDELVAGHSVAAFDALLAAVREA